MISAMYENGGNTLHRHMDGHPELFVYPFESQPGTRFVSDELTSMFPFKYRWPVFPLEGEAGSDFELIFDEEAKTRLRRPDGSKFSRVDLEMEESERKALFIKYMEGKPRTTANIMLAFFNATFAAWKNYNKSGKEKFCLGYSPIICVDTARILNDFPDAKILHIVRHPAPSIAETRRRPYPLSLRRYVWIWSLVQHKALFYRHSFPDNFLIVRYEDLLAKKSEAMKTVAEKLGISFSETMLYPSWNGKKLEDQYPWGTIDKPDEEEQEARVSELSEEELDEVNRISRFFTSELGY